MRVADVLDGKRRWPGYAELLADIEERGIVEPLHYVLGDNVLCDGHSRAAAAQALGLAVVPVLTTHVP